MKTITKLLAFWTVLLGAITVSATPPQATDISQKSKPATVKVLLHRQVPSALLEAKGRYEIYYPLDETKISSGINSNRQTIVAAEYGLKWGEDFKGCHQLRFVPVDSQSCLLVNGIQYRGCIEVWSNDGKLNIINEVGVEPYLKSTLSFTFPEPLHDEVMNAVAIVARTNAYFIGIRNKQSAWHVTASEVGYQGASVLPKKHIDRAVDSTYHLILTYNDAPFAAIWTQNSAGKTVDFAAIFRKAISTPPGVTAPIAAKNRGQSKWTCALPKSMLAQATHLSEVTGIDLYVTPQAEKVYAVKVTGDTQVKDFDFSTFQKIVGSQKLRSNDFTVETHGDELVFTGYGEGPGVGLCLYSAKAQAEKGEKAPQILEAFFPQTKLEKVAR
ncbi:MAG TPA: SpoIID/LytB domain-containing protein [Rhabdochlamydiaceae bacterium]|jgi:stage II sporulation protein D|nr:SpoIID/LytB domain-containing protein [Rhabdochlamydiaceae bacterium]